MITSEEISESTDLQGASANYTFLLHAVLSE